MFRSDRKLETMQHCRLSCNNLVIKFLLFRILSINGNLCPLFSLLVKIVYPLIYSPNKKQGNKRNAAKILPSNFWHTIICSLYWAFFSQTRNFLLEELPSCYSDCLKSKNKMLMSICYLRRTRKTIL